MPKKRTPRPRTPQQPAAVAPDPPGAPRPPDAWEGLLRRADDAVYDRKWATALVLLHRARHAPDAPAGEADALRADVAAWHTLADAVARHQQEARALVRAAVGILLADAQQLYGAAGAPNPTTEELCEWLLTAVETLDMERVDEAVEDASLPRTYLLVHGFAAMGAPPGARP